MREAFVSFVCPLYRELSLGGSTAGYFHHDRDVYCGTNLGGGILTKNL
jgi:hypothetical protein